MSGSVAWARAGTDVYDQLGDLHRGRMCCCCALLAVGLVVVLFGTGTGAGTPESALRSIAARALARRRTTLALNSGLVFGASSRGRHVHHHVSIFTLSTSRIKHFGSETDTMEKNHRANVETEQCSHLGHVPMNCVDLAN